MSVRKNGIVIQAFRQAGVAATLGLFLIVSVASAIGVLFADEPGTDPADSSGAEQPVAAPAEAAAAARSMPEIGATVPAFGLVSVDGTVFRSSDATQAVIVLGFVGVECPLANLYLPKLQELSKQFPDESVLVLAINSNEHDSTSQVRDQARKLNLTIPMLKDAGNVVADAAGATRTPEIVVLDKDRRIQYRGRFDNQFGYAYRRQEATTHETVDAVKAVLSGNTPTITTTKVEGCHIARRRIPRSHSDVTFHRDVLPVLQARCQQCHRSGEAAPFSLMEYDEVSGWAETIKEVVTEKRMPPWFADSKPGQFENDSRLTDDEFATLVKWVDSGAPAGNVADAPPPRTFADGWKIGTPDVVYSMPKAFQVPATGVIDYQFYEVTPTFDEDKWVQAVECRPGDRSVVHHILALVMDPNNRRAGNDGLGRGFFAAAAPGESAILFPPGQAKRIPKGTRIVFQMHYTPNGTATSDQSSMGIVWAKEPPEYEVKTYGIANPRLRIPAGASDHKETKTITLPRDFTITTLFPHLHIRGKSFEYRVQYPDGRKEVLLSIPRWDFNWQLHYRLATPLHLPRGTHITIEARWDNSASNPNNILPLVDVGWGDQTYDEMFIGYVDHIVPYEGDSKSAVR